MIDQEPKGLSPYNSQNAVCGTSESESDSIRGNLIRKQARLTRDLESVNSAITALDASPDTAKVMELVFKANRV